MKLFERTGGHWLFWTGLIYFVIGMIDVFLIEADWGLWLQVLWISVIAFPFTYPPLGRWLNLDIEWDRKMFNWFNKDKTSDNVIPFPESKSTSIPPEPPKEEKKPATTYYRLGLTSDNRVSLQMGYSEITMNEAGVNNLIRQLEVFRDQLQTESETEE